MSFGTLDYDALNATNDICIMKTEDPISFGTYVNAIDPDDGSSSSLGANCSIVGMGQGVSEIIFVYTYFFTPFSHASLLYLCFASLMAVQGFSPQFLSFLPLNDKYSCWSM